MAPRTRNILKRLAVTLASVVGVFIALCVAFLMLLQASWFRAEFAEWLSDRSGKKVDLAGDIRIAWGTTTEITLDHVTIGNPGWAKDPVFLSWERLAVGVRIPNLLRGQMRLPELTITNPKLSLERAADGKATWDFSSNPEGALALSVPAPEKRTQLPYVDQLTVEGGIIHLRDEVKDVDIALQVSSVAGEASARDNLHLEGEGSYNGAPFVLHVTGASAAVLRRNEEPYPIRFYAQFGPTKIEAEGTLDDPFAMKEVKLQLKLAGKSASDLFPITGIALPPTPPYRITGALSYNGKIWRFEDFHGSMGESDLSGDLRWDTSQEPPYLNAEFVSKNLNMADLSGFIGAQGGKDDGRVLPDQPLDISRLMAMNADVTFRGDRIQSTSVLDHFQMNLSLKDGTLKLEPVAFGVAGGNISVNATIEGKETPPRAQAVMVFSKLSLGRFFKPLTDRYGEKNVTAGMLGGKATIRGNGKSLRDILATSNGSLGVGMEGGQLSRLLLELVGLDLFKSAGLVISGDKPVAIRCMVGDFAMENGLLSTRTFLIDTSVTTLRVDGAVNLGNEALDMRLQVFPKDATPLSLRTPILLTGTLGDPDIGLDPKALAAKSGAAAALGVLLTPIASLLAFLEPAEDKPSGCKMFLEALDRKTGHRIPRNANQPAS